MSVDALKDAIVAGQVTKVLTFGRPYVVTVGRVRAGAGSYPIGWAASGANDTAGGRFFFGCGSGGEHGAMSTTRTAADAIARRRKIQVRLEPESFSGS